MLSLQKHEPERSSIISTMIDTIHESENDDYKLFSQFDVVQDFSDHHYAKTSAGKVCCPLLYCTLFLLDITVD
jgi:ubiquitin-conjugating enzyme E2 O